MDTVPDWLDQKAYPFAPHWFDAPAGRLHYVDEGSGRPIVFVHGNATWSFEFRRVIKTLSKEFRCLAADHLGFGLSDKPEAWDYLPENHAANLDAWLESLDLHDATLFVSDWGGPIGLAYALAHPERVRNIAVSNTWLWPVRRDFHFWIFSRFAGGPLGRLLIRKRNFFVRDLLKGLYGDRSLLSPAVHRHYLMPLAAPADRKGNWTFPKRIVDSAEWLAELWRKRDTLKDMHMVLLWGLRDPAFRNKELQRWSASFNFEKTLIFHDAGHLLAEEAPDIVAAELAMLAKE